MATEKDDPFKNSEAAAKRKFDELEKEVGAEAAEEGFRRFAWRYLDGKFPEWTHPEDEANGDDEDNGDERDHGQDGDRS